MSRTGCPNTTGTLPGSVTDAAVPGAVMLISLSGAPSVDQREEQAGRLARGEVAAEGRAEDEHVPDREVAD